MCRIHDDCRVAITSKQLPLIRVILPTKWRATSIVQGMSDELDRRLAAREAEHRASAERGLLREAAERAPIPGRLTGCSPTWTPSSPPTRRRDLARRCNFT
jgi:hypothetical protein